MTARSTIRSASFLGRPKAGAGDPYSRAGDDPERLGVMAAARRPGMRPCFERCLDDTDRIDDVFLIDDAATHR